jgi:hypothetical protein
MKISIPQNISLLSDDACSNKQFTEVSNSLYSTFPLYSEKWSNNVLPLDMLHWRLLKNTPTRENILHRTQHTANADKYITMILDKDGLFDEFVHIAKKVKLSLK